jgi:hypothetical protein
VRIAEYWVQACSLTLECITTGLMRLRKINVRVVVLSAARALHSQHVALRVHWR